MSHNVSSGIEAIRLRSFADHLTAPFYGNERMTDPIRAGEAAVPV
jgi:hypothetical protein